MKVHFRGLILKTSDNVYLPSDDSYLLAESVKVNGGRVLDIGCGTGIQALAAAEHADYVLGVDVNPEAVALAVLNAKNNNINAEFRISDLFENVGGKFDTIIFNPPYLPAKDEGELAKAWSGGFKGAEITYRFIAEVSKHLKHDGRAYILVSSLNNLDEVLAYISSKGLKKEVVAGKKLFFEELYAVCLHF